MNSFFQKIITDYHLGFFTLYGLYSAFKDTLFFLFKITLDLPESEIGSEPDAKEYLESEFDSESESESEKSRCNLDSPDSELSEIPDFDLSDPDDDHYDPEDDPVYDREINYVDNSENVDPEYILPGYKKLTINLKKRKKIVIE